MRHKLGIQRERNSLPSQSSKIQSDPANEILSHEERHRNAKIKQRGQIIEEGAWGDKNWKKKNSSEQIPCSPPHCLTPKGIHSRKASLPVAWIRSSSSEISHHGSPVKWGWEGSLVKQMGEKKLDRKFPAGTRWECVVFQPQAPDDGT